MNQTVGRYRWTICSLVFFATTINYLDRAVISLLKGTLEKEFSWTETDYSNIVIIFQLMYALGMLGAGRLIDKLGTRIGYALATFLWSVAAMSHAFVSGLNGFLFARGFLGVTESGNFPAAIKATAEWFPQRERALATGIFNSGANVGAILAPLTVPFIAEQWGWQWAFLITGFVGFIWLIFWFLFYEIPTKHKKVTAEELAYINIDADTSPEGIEEDKKPVSWIRLFGFRQTWAFILGKFLTDPVWWFYLFWLPDFLKKEYGITGTGIAMPIAIAYTIATFGSVIGGWLPLKFINSGWPVFRSRKTSMLIYALIPLTVLFAQYLGSINMWFAVIVIAFAMAAHQAWSANIFTTVSDMFPKRATASVTGIGGMFGALGGIVIAKAAGLLFDHYNAMGNEKQGYFVMFIICGLAYITAWLIMHLLVPKMKPVKL
jgi:MFS transporter, ACS family, hexuronate transporter